MQIKMGFVYKRALCVFITHEERNQRIWIIPTFLFKIIASHIVCIAADQM